VNSRTDFDLEYRRAPARTRVRVGQDCLSSALEFFGLAGKKSLVVVDERCSALLDQCSLAELPCFSLPAGEQKKEVESLTNLWSFFHQQRLDRSAALIAIGGGSVSDVVGFAAATYMRGVPLYLIPTTTLSAFDASIGGKNSINFANTKNLLGTIYQPKGVLIDVNVLCELPPPEFLSGFAEIIKHAALADRALWQQLAGLNPGHIQPDILVELITKSIQIKGSFVINDELDLGRRMALNFGHTLGHAIEAACNHSSAALSHGEAIAIGMTLEANFLNRDDVARSLASILGRYGLPSELPLRTIREATINALMSDKKNIGDLVQLPEVSELGCYAGTRETRLSDLVKFIHSL